MLARADDVEVPPKPNGFSVVFDETGMGFVPNADVADRSGLNGKPPLGAGAADVAELNGDPKDNAAVGLSVPNAEDVGAVLAVLSAG